MKPQMIVIDMNPSWDGHLSWQMKPLIQRISAFVNCLSSDWQLYFSLFQNHPDSPFIQILKWTHFQELPELDRSLGRINRENIFIYHRYSALTPELSRQLHRDSPVYICGIFTDVSIWKTALDLFEQDFHPVVLSDLVDTPHGQDVHFSVLNSLRHSIGSQNIILSSDLLSEYSK